MHQELPSLRKTKDANAAESANRKLSPEEKIAVFQEIWGSPLYRATQNDAEKAGDHIFYLDKEARRLRFGLPRGPEGARDDMIEVLSKKNPPSIEHPVILFRPEGPEGDVYGLCEGKRMPDPWGNFLDVGITVEKRFRSGDTKEIRGFVGTALLASLIEEARKIPDCYGLCVMALKENSKMISLAKSFGFKENSYLTKLEEGYMVFLLPFNDKIEAARKAGIDYHIPDTEADIQETFNTSGM
jgi:hypothetical protein